MTNVDNIGAFFRIGAAFGIDGLLFDATCCDPLYRKAVRVSMGHVLSVPWSMAPEQQWLETLNALRTEWGMTLIAAESGCDAKPLWDVQWPERCAIVVGSEGPGLPAETLELCDATVEIPMHARAVGERGFGLGICLYERTRGLPLVAVAAAVVEVVVGASSVNGRVTTHGTPPMTSPLSLSTRWICARASSTALRVGSSPDQRGRPG